MNNPRPEIDGTGLALHHGIGAGVRLQQGQAFVVRADVAWSPDVRPVGAYIVADEIFWTSAFARPCVAGERCGVDPDHEVTVALGAGSDRESSGRRDARWGSVHRFA